MKHLVWIAAAAAALTLQAQGVKEFEVASVKPNKSGDGRVGIRIAPGGRWTATNLPLVEFLQIAFDLRPGQMTGAPGWIRGESFDIEAKLPAELGANLKPDELRPYLQTLLAQRFGLKFHREKKEMTVYALVVNKGGIKMKESDPAARGPMMRMGRGQLTGNKIAMDMLAMNLSRQTGRPVLNETGLTGTYDFELTFAPEAPAGPGGPGGPGGGGGEPPPNSEAPTVFTAVQEQLGLKLESRKAPVDLFVIDEIKRPEEN